MVSGASASTLDVLGDARTVLLTTFKRDGTPVPTPVWVVRDGGELLVWTSPRTGKYKRIRNNPRVTLVPCSFRGKPYGEPVVGAARLLSEPEMSKVIDKIKWKYGWFGRFSLWQSGLAVRFRHWPAFAGLGLTVDESTTASS
jgi:hypothetical protein